MRLDSKRIGAHQIERNPHIRDAQSLQVLHRQRSHKSKMDGRTKSLTRLFIITITCGDGLRDFLLCKHEVQPLAHKLERSEDQDGTINGVAYIPSNRVRLCLSGYCRLGRRVALRRSSRTCPE